MTGEHRAVCFRNYARSHARAHLNTGFKGMLHAHGDHISILLPGYSENDFHRFPRIADELGLNPRERLSKAIAHCPQGRFPDRDSIGTLLPSIGQDVQDGDAGSISPRQGNHDGQNALAVQR